MSAPISRFRLLAVLLAGAACNEAAPISVVDQPRAQPDEDFLVPRAPVLDPEVWLAVDTFAIAANTFGNPAAITMWGYSSCTANFASCAAPTVPGPALRVAEGTTLTVHLLNRLVGPYVEPTSVVVQGQVASLQPVWVNPATGTVTGVGSRPAGDVTSRVRSFNAETPADASTITTYSFTALKAGTYLYESGTHPSVQVQMGLYGALSVYPARAGRAYDDASSTFSTEATLLFSELDPTLHDAVASGHYGPNPNAPGAPPIGWLTSTIGYKPSYFLVNGKPWSPTSAPLPGGRPGSTLLLRLLNAGLETKVPQLQGPYLSVIAEDGNFITVTTPAHQKVAAPREQYSVLLPAGKTVDALVTPTDSGDLAIFDRRLNLTNHGGAPGGLYAYLTVGTNNPETQQISATPFVFFPTTRIGHTVHGTVTITNSGLASREITSLTIATLGAPGDAAYFSVSASAPLVVAGGQSVQVQVAFTPGTAGLKTALLQLGTNDPVAPTLSSLLFGLSF